MENKKLHLQMIEAIIARMADKSFDIKKWTITICVALWGIAFSDQSKLKVSLVAIIPITIFWLLDSMYLMQERKYIKLYDVVRQKKEQNIDFNMSFDSVSINMKEIRKYEYIRVIFSKTEFLVYIALMVISAVIYFIKF